MQGIMASEKEIQNQILIRFGARHDMRIWRNNTGAIKVGERFVSFGLKGSADILGLLRGGRFLAIEVKAASGRQSPDQKSFQKMIEDFGGLYILARSVEDVERGLENGTELAKQI